MPTDQDIADIQTAAAQSAEDGVQSATVDGQAVTAMDPIKQLDVADRLANADALDGTNDNGGAISGFQRLRPGRAVFRGTAE